MSALPEKAPPGGTATGTDGPLPLDDVRDFFEARAAAVDRGEADVAEGIRYVARLGLLELGTADGVASRALSGMADVVSAVAWADMSSAFSLWCHRMVLEYLSAARSRPQLEQWFQSLRTGSVMGSTALASASNLVLDGTPLPLRYRTVPDGLELSGPVPWASNLGPTFLVVCAAGAEGGGGPNTVVAVPSTTAGVERAPYPRLLALQATWSAALTFDAARVPSALRLSDDFDRFVACVLPTFVVLQSALCRGIALRAIEEARAAGARYSVAERDLHEVEERFSLLASELDAVAADEARIERPLTDQLALRYRWARLAHDAVFVELRAAGGRGYARDSGTARRLREVAFLPVQTPTELQLRCAIES